jgi:hypothetical protein
MTRLTPEQVEKFIPITPLKEQKHAKPVQGNLQGL